MLSRAYSAAVSAHGIKRAAVVGAGQLGQGIAYVSARVAGVDTILYDSSEKQLAKGFALFDKLLSKEVAKGKTTDEEATATLARLRTVSTLAQLTDHDPDIVFEAIPEQVELKQALFGTLASTLSARTILASNTSSISLTTLAAAAVPAPGSLVERASSPEDILASSSRVVGCHWMNPVPVMRLVELISALQTTPDVMSRTKAFAEACGKETTVSKDTPGFIANRILIPYINEAVFCLEEGVASKEDIDKTSLLAFNQPLGCLQLADMIGLDTVLAIGEVLHRETGDSKYRPPVLLRRKVAAGHLGRKSGQGFYVY
ncbi:uncharacterized protein L969DRAFT_96805 [Mixia osmundae IAM 14324]|uniref:3-hydroxyacyl-CoA dehydrogenase NAD binding domain-containing protein n=1 Tax=Mixia osmundae (strain CBS 9802 / IAM 14324 / JCM 22182 / KY 12970) TaxID=764103 RepID=G7E253_MIXOS|nr:uncharacterized protein L969DRAFT_96805 [Mixia osmundae IAM 14324]KEI36785.1 hypothetical protein L969DRAFT_96805 [Mixia osmundae IAM 14324]GAA96913.1 hypothetical protein E5Q_03587 [Mixia osmundae IAM 14324]